MSSANAFELPPHSAAPAEAVDAAEHGQVVYLTRNGETFAAVIPAADIEMLEDAEDLAALRAARTEPGPNIPMADVLAEFAEDLAAHPADDA